MKTVFRNGIIYHGRHLEGFNKCNTMVINKGLIDYVGDHPDSTTQEESEEGNFQEIDLKGRSIFPAFIDGHMHLVSFGASLLKVGLDYCKNLEDIRATIAEAANKMPDANRILCRGWRQSTTNRQALSSMIDDIDARPIFIDADDLHSAWCNSAALKEMGIDRNTPDPPQGKIHRDEDGNPTGLLSESAVLTLVWPHLARKVSKDGKLNYIRAAIKEYHASGYTGVIEMAMEEGDWKLLESLHETGQLKIRIAAHWIIIPTGNDADNVAQVQDAIKMHAKYNLDNSPDFRIAGIKVICDGVVDSCTAALSKPYFTPENVTGDLMWTQSALQQVASRADAAHLQIALHAIGDAAINLAINTLENLGTTGRRHRIEHLELTHPTDAKRLGKLGITASIQPVHSDPSILGAWPELLGSERCDWAFAYRDFHNHSAQLAIGTDSPTAPHLPFPNLYVLNTRTSARDPLDRHKINQRPGLELHHALNAASWGAAYSCFAEKMTGSLEVGKRADFIVVDGISQHLDAATLMQASIAETWMGGQQVYTRQA